jgi:molybdopterin-guanine dinucleotide biosynthesis protein B
VAIAADHEVEDAAGLALFDLNDTIAIADFVARTVDLGAPPSPQPA